MIAPNTFKHGYPFDKYSMVPCVTFDRDPTTSDLNHPTAGGFYPLPTIWTNKSSGNSFILSSITSGTTANWDQIAAVPATGGAAATKGTFTLTAGSSGAIATTAALTGSVIVVNVHTLGTVTAASSFLTTINNGVSFTITASQVTDTSSGTWAIVG